MAPTPYFSSEGQRFATLVVTELEGEMLQEYGKKPPVHSTAESPHMLLSVLQKEASISVKIM
jgi:hypothetical protein